MTDLPLRVALVGIGKIARDQHVPAIASDPRIELVATASRHGRIGGVTGFSTIEELIASGTKVDAVAIATPPVGRHLIARTAIDAGLHVMIEKPPGATLSEVETLTAHAAASGVTLFASWHSREAAEVDPARQWLAKRTIRAVSIQWREDIRRWHPGQDWILGPGGFGVFDPGINALSIVSAILPQPIHVVKADLDIPRNRQSPIKATLAMASGMTELRAEFDFLHEGDQQWDIIVDTDGGQLALRDGGRTLEIEGSTSSGEDEEYRRLYRRFTDLVLTGASDTDVTPLRLVADAYLVGSTRVVQPFNW